MAKVESAQKSSLEKKVKMTMMKVESIVGNHYKSKSVVGNHYKSESVVSNHDESGMKLVTYLPHSTWCWCQSHQHMGQYTLYLSSQAPRLQD